MQNKLKLLLSDLDGTFIRNSMHDLLMNELFKNKIFNEKLFEQYNTLRDKWKTRKSHDSYEKFNSESVKIMVENLAGSDFVFIEKTANEIIDSSWEHTYVFPKWLYMEAKSFGYCIGAISHSPDFMVEMFCKKHKFDFWYGSLYEIDNNKKFTENIISFPKSETISKIKLENKYSFLESIAIGDTESDIPMLEAVTYPICFNPTKGLAMEAKQRGWPIVMERKNLILVNGEIFNEEHSLAEFFNIK